MPRESHGEGRTAQRDTFAPMPVHKVPGGYRWGESGKTYRTRAAAERQARAIFASGYREDARSRRAAHRALSPSKSAESRYVLALLGIMGRVHATVLGEIAPADEHADARTSRRLDAPDDRLVRRLFRVVRAPVQTAFDFMAGAVDKSVARGMKLVGIQPRTIPGLGAVMTIAREKNVRLIQSASEDFVRQVRDVLDENEGLRPEEIADLLEERSGVSKSRATVIARTETVKLNSQMVEHRARSAGLQKYKWSAAMDERTRESHAELDGEIFAWDDPGVSDDGVENHADVDGGACHAGQTINCRCVPLPYIEDLEDAEAPAEEEEAEEGYAAAAEE